MDNYEIQKEQARKWIDDLTKITKSFKLNNKFSLPLLNGISENSTLNPNPDIISTKNGDVLAFKKYINDYIEAGQNELNLKVGDR